MLFSQTAIADQTFNGVDVTCLSRYNAIRVEHRAVEHLRSLYRKTCVLKSSKLEVRVHTEKPTTASRCGAQPGSSLTMEKDGQAIVDLAPYGDACSQGPTISSVEYFGDSDRLIVCVSPSGLVGPASVSFCKTPDPS